MRAQAGDFGFTLHVIVIELNAGAVFERHEQAVGGWRPGIAECGKIQFFDDEWMEQACKVSARRHANAGPGFFDGASASDAFTRFENKNAFAGPGEIGGASEAVVSGSDDEGIPTAVG
jgi:hypothetical protein